MSGLLHEVYEQLLLLYDPTVYFPQRQALAVLAETGLADRLVTPRARAQLHTMPFYPVGGRFSLWDFLGQYHAVTQEIREAKFPVDDEERATEGMLTQARQTYALAYARTLSQLAGRRLRAEERERAASTTPFLIDERHLAMLFPYADFLIYLVVGMNPSGMFWDAETESREVNEAQAVHVDSLRNEWRLFERAFTSRGAAQFSSEEMIEHYRVFIALVRRHLPEAEALLGRLQSERHRRHLQSGIGDAKRVTDGLERLMDTSEREVDFNELIEIMQHLVFSGYYADRDRTCHVRFAPDRSLPSIRVRQDEAAYLLLSLLMPFWRQAWERGRIFPLEVSTAEEETDGARWIAVRAHSSELSLSLENIPGLNRRDDTGTGYPLAVRLAEHLGGRVELIRVGQAVHGFALFLPLADGAAAIEQAIQRYNSAILSMRPSTRVSDIPPRKRRRFDRRATLTYHRLLVTLDHWLNQRRGLAATYVYPARGPDLIFDLIGTVYAVNDDPSDVDWGLQVLENALGSKKANVLRARGRRLRQEPRDALLKASYEPLLRERPPHLRLIMKGVNDNVELMNNTEAANPASRSRDVESILRYLFDHVLQPGDHVIILDRNDRDYATLANECGFVPLVFQDRLLGGHVVHMRDYHGRGGFFLPDVVMVLEKRGLSKSSTPEHLLGQLEITLKAIRETEQAP